MSAGLLRFVVRRLFVSFLILLNIYTLIFILMRCAPGDPVDRILPQQATPEQKQRQREALGLDEPLVIQYFESIGKLLVLDFGTDINNHSVWETMRTMLPKTIWLLLPATLLAFIFGVKLGRRIAWRHHGVFDNGITFVALIFFTMFTYWLALIVIRVFANELGWFFDGGAQEEKLVRYPYDSSEWPLDSAPSLWSWLMLNINAPGLRNIVDFIYHLILPTFVLFINLIAYYMLYMRQNMLEVLRDDFVQTARGKGVPESAIRKYHAGRNAMLPVVTLFVLQVSFLVGGAVLVEAAFDWPGLGNAIFTGILRQNYALVQGSVILLSGLVLIGTLVADILYSIIDPRVKLKG